MKQFKRYWKSIPYPRRLAINLFLIAVLTFALYVFISAPPFTTEIKFRRAEKANLVGPSEILGQCERGFSVYDRLLLAREEDGVIIYAESTWDDAKPELIYREKTGALTVLAAPDPTPYSRNDSARLLTIFAFDSHPEAVRAEMDVTLPIDPKGKNTTSTHTVEAFREQEGYFGFTFGLINKYGLGDEGYSMQIFTLISGYGGRNFTEYVFPVTVRFYDPQDVLIAEESTTVMSAASRTQLP